MTLTELAKKHGATKAEHNYMPLYERIINPNASALLEIGIDQGGSALMWREYMPNADIWFLDLFSPQNKQPEWCIENNIIPIKGSQSDVDLLFTIEKSFDYIIDDGSHNAYDQWISLKHLWDNVAHGGYYIIEDCQCNFEKFYWNEMIKDFSHTPAYVFGKYSMFNKLEMPQWLSMPDISKEIESVEMYDLYKLIVIKKK